MTRAAAWTQAFDRAISEGFTPLQAGLIADRVVRDLGEVIEG